MQRCNLVLPILVGTILVAGAIAAGQEMHSGAILNPNMRIPLPPQGKPAVDTDLAASGSNAFAFDLYARLNGTEGANLFFSPYSISSALSMVYAGARGETADEMLTALRFPMPAQKALRPPEGDREIVGESFAALNHQLSGDPQAQGFTLSIANGLWGQKGEPFLPDYLDVVKKDFGGELTPVDFITQADAARQQINHWVADKTHDKIKDLLAPGTVTPDDRLILVNAIYFKGKWNDAFDPKQTSKQMFFIHPAGNGNTVQVDMMHRTGHLLYAEDNLCQAVELPYKGDRLAMLVLLPKPEFDPNGRGKTNAEDPNSGMPRLQRALNPQYLDHVIGRLADTSVNLALPKWEATRQFSLGDALQAMGMKLAFSGKADFSGINGRTDLAISSVTHKAYVKVDEEGTEAAGATAADMSGSATPPPPPVNFTADHAFVYFIIDKPTHAILFAGQLSDPTREN